MDQCLDIALDECLSLLLTGADHKACLELYSCYTPELDSLLALAEDVRRVHTPPPLHASYLAGQQRMLTALAQCRDRHS
jgi:hypothetical protein